MFLCRLLAPHYSQSAAFRPLIFQFCSSCQYPSANSIYVRISNHSCWNSNISFRGQLRELYICCHSDRQSYISLYIIQGMPYKYVVSVDSKAFNTAPDVILAALGRLTWAARETVKGDEFRAPNELLTLGYFEKMSIGVS